MYSNEKQMIPLAPKLVLINPGEKAFYCGGSGWIGLLLSSGVYWMLFPPSFFPLADIICFACLM